MKVVVHNTYGGVYIPEAIQQELGLGKYDDVVRHDPKVVAAYEKLDSPDFSIIDIGDKFSYKINEYDGKEWVEIDKMHYIIESLLKMRSSKTPPAKKLWGRFPNPSLLLNQRPCREQLPARSYSRTAWRLSKHCRRL